jgi:hypothetical protein
MSGMTQVSLADGVCQPPLRLFLLEHVPLVLDAVPMF